MRGYMADMSVRNSSGAYLYVDGNSVCCKYREVEPKGTICESTEGSDRHHTFSGMDDFVLFWHVTGKLCKI